MFDLDSDEFSELMNINFKLILIKKIYLIQLQIIN